MDIEFADDIIDILEYIGKKFGIVVDWSADNVLPYLKELSVKYITYKISVATMWIIVFSIVMLVAAIAAIIICRAAKKQDYELSTDDGEFWAIAVCIVVIIFAFCCIVYNVYNLIVCKTFPEKVLYEYITSVYNSVKNN